MEIKFTDAELETISAALDDYVYYDSEDLSEDELIGGIPVIDRIDSIQDKIEKLLTFNSLMLSYNCRNSLDRYIILF